MIGARLRVGLAAAMLIGSACHPGPRPFRPHRGAFFDPALFQELQLGEASEEQVAARLGPPYLETRSGEGRVLWVYDFNPTRQLTLYFSGDVLVEKGWTLSYPNPLDPEKIFEARPELRDLRRQPEE